MLITVHSLRQLTRSSVIALGFALAIGCSSSAGQHADGDAGPGGADGADAGGQHAQGRRLWKQDAFADARLVALSIAADDSIAVAFVRDVNGTDQVMVATSGAAGFDVSQVAPYSGGGSISVAHDSNGQVHLAWAGAGVTYAVRQGAQWTVESTGISDGDPTLALGPDDKAHIAVLGRGPFKQPVVHAVRDASGWRQSSVADTRNSTAKSRIGLVVSSANEPWIAASADDGQRVLLWRQTSGSWTSETVYENKDSAPLYGLTTVAIDATGAPRVAFIAQSGLYLAQRQGSVWSVEPLAVPSMSWYWSARGWLDLAIGGGSVFVVAAAESRFGSALKAEGVMLFERTATGSWTFQQLLGRGCSESQFALASDTAGLPRLAHACGATALLSVVGEYPSDWQQRCADVSAVLCDAACACNSTFEPCTWLRDGGKQGSSPVGCPGNMSNVVCGNPTVTPAMLAACAADAKSSVCESDTDGEALRFSSACAAIPPQIGE